MNVLLLTEAVVSLFHLRRLSILVLSLCLMSKLAVTAVLRPLSNFWVYVCFSVEAYVNFARMYSTDVIPHE